MQLSITQVSFIGFALLELVSGIPELHRAADGREYLIDAEAKYNWYEAGHFCADRDYQLLTIGSAIKNNVIVGLLQKVLGRSHNLWLGGNDEYSTSLTLNRPFYWTPSGKKFTFTNWAADNPNNARGSENCAHIWDYGNSYEWNDNICTTKMGLICEMNRNLEAYTNNVQNKCDALQSARTEMNMVRNSTRTAIQKYFDHQKSAVTQFSADMEQSVNNFSATLTKSFMDMGQRFEKILSANDNNLKDIC